MKKLAVLASGQGTNLEAIFQAIERGKVAAEVGLVISDREKAPALVKAHKRGVNTQFVDPLPYINREQ
ncbi:MAG TPA: phosphoribosylglycinamide formyltransferase, partial [Firmicutes bacterium]|nr:phosphoribosylglycinamide formyltransferase [Bacillota bacterium]